MRATLRAGILAVGFAAAAESVLAQSPPAHEVTATPGSHPRLILSAAEVDAARAKVNAAGTWSNSLFTATVGATIPYDLSGPTDVPEFWNALRASQPMLALLAAGPADRQNWARSAINLSLAAIRQFDPPYPDNTYGYPEWYGRFLYRFIALTYDSAYDQMTAAERTEFQNEMLRIAAWIASGGFDRDPNNHNIVLGVGLELTALAIDGDVSGAPRAIVDEPVVRTSTTPSGDFLAFRSGCSSLSAAATPGGAALWFDGVDFDVVWIRKDANTWDSGRAIVWRAGHGPAAGQTYYASYTFTPDFPSWKDRPRLAFQRNLDHIWADGASMAGVFYGDWTMAWMLDAFEAIRRTTGFDFAQHPAVRDAVLWHPSELIAPAPGSGNILRVNNRNDGGYDDLDDTAGAGAPTYWTWVMARYPNDPGGRNKVAYWLLQHSDRWTFGARWREALWVDDAFSGPPPLAPAPPLTLPLSRFFAGHNLANFRTGPWDGPAGDWSLFSFVAGPFSLSEHNHADRGSFTFHALGEDFAIDSGYAFSNGTWDSTPGHNYILVTHPLYNGGTCSPSSTTDRQDYQGGAEIRSRVLSSAFDAVDADLRKTYIPTANLPFDGPPPCWPVRTADRSVVFLKRAGRAPFAIVSDSLDVDGSPHPATWLMHTGAGNAIAINGTTARLTGARTGATLDVYVAAAATPTLTQDSVTSPDPGVGTHPRLLAGATAPNARFLAILVPEKAGEAAPLAVQTVGAADDLLVTVTGGGLVDTIVQNRTTGAVVSVSGIETDGSLAVVRSDSTGAVLAWLVQNATYLKRSGVDLWRAVAPAGARGSAAYDGTSLSVTADDVTEFRALAQNSTTFEGPNGTMTGARSGGQLHWAGSRRLLDTTPAGVDAFADDFSNNVTPDWVDYPLWSKFVRVASGELCAQGSVYPVEMVSHTKRTYGPLRADTFQAPRSVFGDATQSGEFTVESAPAGTKVVIMGRVVDRSVDNVPYVLPWPLTVDQDYVKVEIPVDSGGTTNVWARRGGGGAADRLLCSGPGGTTSGQKHAYALSIQGSTVTFALDGTPVCSATDATGTVPPAGYFQWVVAQSAHIHFDDVRVSLPGTTYACTGDADCDDGLYCTQDHCNTATHACEHPPLVCDNPSPYCYDATCNESTDSCDLTPGPNFDIPWRCGAHWCICG